MLQRERVPTSAASLTPALEDPGTALPAETKFESGTSQNRSGTSVNVSNSGNLGDELAPAHGDLGGGALGGLPPNPEDLGRGANGEDMGRGANGKNLGRGAHGGVEEEGPLHPLWFEYALPGGVRAYLKGSDGTLSLARPEAGPASLTLHPTPYNLHPTPYTLHPTPCTLHPTSYTLHPKPYALHPTPYTLHPTPDTRHPAPYPPHPTSYTLHPAPCTPHPSP